MNKLFKALDKFNELLNDEVGKLVKSDKLVAEYLTDKQGAKFDQDEFKKVFEEYQSQLHYLMPIIEYCINSGKLLEKGVQKHNENIQMLIDSGLLVKIDSPKNKNKNES